MSRAVLVASSLVVGAVVLGACGGAPAPAQAPKSTGPTTPSDEREPTSVEEAQQQIDRASAELAGGAGAEKKTPAAADSAPEPRTEEAAKPAACASSCRALASMRRAVTALCRMAGEGDTRCSDAKKTLADSESRVASCHCAS